MMTSTRDIWSAGSTSGPGQRCRVEVVNLAVAGDSPTRRLLRLQQEAERYHRRLAAL